MKPAPAIKLLLLSSLVSCTGALSTQDIRKGNADAPPELQIAEDCEYPDPTQPCRVIIKTLPTDGENP